MHGQVPLRHVGLASSNVFDDMYRMGRWLVWRKSINFWRRYWAENDFHIFLISDLDLWPLDLKLAPLVTLIQRYVPLSSEYLWLSCFEKIGGTGRTDIWTGGQTDRQTDGVQRLSALEF